MLIESGQKCWPVRTKADIVSRERTDIVSKKLLTWTVTIKLTFTVLVTIIDALGHFETG